MPTGTETSTAFLQAPSTRTRLSSMPKVAATRPSCAFAISNGFSRRCEIGASTVVTEWRVYGPSPETEPEAPLARGAGLHGVGDDPEHVVAGRQALAVRASAGEAEGIAARQHVPEPRERPDLRSVGPPEHDVEPGDRADLRVPGDGEDAACVDREERRLRVRPVERLRREGCGGDQIRVGVAERNRPRQADAAAAVHGDEDG